MECFNGVIINICFKSKIQYIHEKNIANKSYVDTRSLCWFYFFTYCPTLVVISFPKQLYEQFRFLFLLLIHMRPQNHSISLIVLGLCLSFQLNIEENSKIVFQKKACIVRVVLAGSSPHKLSNNNNNHTIKILPLHLNSNNKLSDESPKNTPALQGIKPVMLAREVCIIHSPITISNQVFDMYVLKIINITYITSGLFAVVTKTQRSHSESKQLLKQRSPFGYVMFLKLKCSLF